MLFFNFACLCGVARELITKTAKEKQFQLDAVTHGRSLSFHANASSACRDTSLLADALVL